MLKIHVKLLSKVLMLTLRDMEVGMIYKGKKNLPKLVVHKTARSIIIRNVGEERTMTLSLNKHSHGRVNGLRPMKVFAIAKNDSGDIEKLVTKTQSL